MLDELKAELEKTLVVGEPETELEAELEKGRSCSQSSLS